MKADLPLSNATSWCSSQNYQEQTASPVLPRVNIGLSQRTSVPPDTGLQRRSGIPVHTQTCLPSLRQRLPKSFRLYRGLRENERQIDTRRNSLELNGAQDDPITAYNHNKVALRSLETATADNLRVPIARHSNRIYRWLEGNVREQTQAINTLLEDNLRRTIQSFASIGPLLHFAESELSELFTLPNTFSSLQESLSTLFQQDLTQHSGNAETIQSLYRLTCLVDEKQKQEHRRSQFYSRLKEILESMTVVNMRFRLDSLNTMESLIDFVKHHHSNIKILSTSNRSALIKDMLNTIERLPEAKVTAQSLFLLDEAVEDIFKDSAKRILKKAFSVLANEVDSLAHARTAFNRIHRYGLGNEEAAKKLLSKICAYITHFDAALDTFVKINDANPNIDDTFFDTLYEKVVSLAVSADHFYRLSKNLYFHKDHSDFCRKGLEKNPDHSQLKQRYKQLIEYQINQQLDKATETSRIALLNKYQSQIDDIIQSHEDRYQQQFHKITNKPRAIYNGKFEEASTAFKEADSYFGYIRGRTSPYIKSFQKHLNKGIKLALDAMMVAPTNEMRADAKQLINSYYERSHSYYERSHRTVRAIKKKFKKPAQIDEHIKKIEAYQTKESIFKIRKTAAINKLRHQLEDKMRNITYEFDNNASKKKQELNSSLQLLHKGLGSYYSNLSLTSPTNRYFSIDGFWMPALYISLFLSLECSGNMAGGYAYNLDNTSDDLAPNTLTENLSMPASDFAADPVAMSFDSSQLPEMSIDLDIPDVSLDLDIPDVSLDLDVASADDYSGFDDSGLDYSGLDYSGLDYSGGGYSGGGDYGGFDFSGGDFGGGGYSGGGDFGGGDFGGGIF
ncbi:hypothetical protein [Endozoicomonas sp. ONNA2]|uniref:hypothetical protein n=1 Tax=Endozoicomonas sp. ONNA2 TaxID=2828741 RepID=UPI002148524E|nr:hypothetical protein [Endozoicomonas sp. ONNA2]